jgi:predicted nucleic-acid-binding protein
MPTERAFADTNLFLRYLTNDIPSQADAVESLLCRAARSEIALVVNPMVIAEIVWTLESFYHLSPGEIKSKIFAVLNTPGLEVAEADVVVLAMDLYADRNIDFIDAYNTCWMTAHGLDTIYTFDRRHFARIDNIYIVEPRDG